MRAMITEEEKQDIGDAYFEEGKLQKTKEIAKNLLQRGLDLESVCEITGLTEEQAKSLV